MVAPAAQRHAVAHLMENHGMRERRACRGLGCCPMSMRYAGRQDDPVLSERLKELAAGAAKDRVPVAACLRAA